MSCYSEHYIPRSSQPKLFASYGVPKGVKPTQNNETDKVSQTSDNGSSYAQPNAHIKQENFSESTSLKKRYGKAGFSKLSHNTQTTTPGEQFKCI